MTSRSSSGAQRVPRSCPSPILGAVAPASAPVLRPVAAIEDGESFRHVEAALEGLGCRTARRRNGLMPQCPAHNDHTPSLSVTEADGRVLLNCFAGCDVKDVVEALGLDMAELFDGELVSAAPPAEPDRYVYRDARGRKVFAVVRGEGKKFHTEHWDAEGRCWRRGRREITPLLYNLREVLRAVGQGDQTVYVVEGERDAETLIDRGFLATTNPHGAGNWEESFSQVLAGANVVVIADKDAPGRKHAAQVAESLKAQDCLVSLVQACSGKDVTDHIAAGHSISDLVPMEDRPAEKPAGKGLGFDPTRVMGLQELWEMPPLVPLVQGLFDRGDLAMVYGMWSSGKSFFALDVALSVATGTDWHGRKVHAGPVLYVAAEAVRGLPRRIESWLDHYDADDPENFFIYPQPIQLTTEGVGRAVGRYAAEKGAVLVIIDTVGRCIAGAEENSAKEMGVVVRELEDMKRTCSDLTVVYIHHTDKTAKWARGSSVFGASVDASFRVTKVDDGFMVLNDKVREHEPAEPMQFHLLSAGKSVVAVETPWTGAPENPSDVKILEILEADPGGLMQKELSHLSGLSAATVSTALTRLEEQGQIKRTHEGRSLRCTLVR